MVTIENNGCFVFEHLSVEFFCKVLEIGLNLSKVKVTRLDFQLGSSAGDNFASVLYRVRIHYTTDAKQQKISLIVKCITFDGPLEIFQRLNVYGREVTMYEKALPAIENLLISKNICTKIAPKLIYSQKAPVCTIVFEDLLELGVIMKDRIVGFDEEHARVAIAKLGQFHAGSMVFARDHPEVLLTFEKVSFHDDYDSDAREQLFRQNTKFMAEFVKNWDGFEEISSKLMKVYENYFERLIECVEKDVPYKVINHGDYWVNNCMFLNQEDKLKDILMIDFQLSFYGTPGLDLHYFLYTSVQHDVLISKRYDLLVTYYNSFRSTLEALSYTPIVSWEEFKNEIRRTEILGFFAVSGPLPLQCMDKDVSGDNEVGMCSDENMMLKKRQQMFSTKRFLHTLRYSLQRFDELGVFD